MRHSKFNIRKVRVLVAIFSVLLLLDSSLPWWWMASFVTFDFLLQFILSNETLMFCSVVVVWEDLGQEHVHIISLMLSLIGHGLNVWLASGRLVRCCGLFWNLLFHALVSQVKHFSCERLRHDVLARSSSSSARVCNCMWSFRFRSRLINQGGRVVSCILRWSIHVVCRRQVVGRSTRVVKTRCSLESRASRINACHVYAGAEAALRWIEVGTSLESLVHHCNLLLHSNLGDRSKLPLVVLRGRMALRSSSLDLLFVCSSLVVDAL